MRKYEAFLKTVELGSLTAAAQALGRTQSAVSHGISGFEKELGFGLISRSKSGIKLTDRGRKMLPLIRALAEAEDAVYAGAEQLRNGFGGIVRVAAFTSVAVHWLPGIIKRFGELCPNVELEMYNGDYSDVDNWLSEGKIDVAFVTLPVKEEYSYTVLRDDRLMAILPPEHPLAGLERVPVEELAKEPFISLLQSSDQDIRRAFGAAGVKPDVRYTTKDDYAIIAMVAQGLGVSVVPELLIEGRHDGVAVRPIEPESKRTIALASRGDSSLSPAAELFVKCVQQLITGD